MAHRLVVAPTVEPVTLEEAKSHLRVIGDDENTTIEALIRSAREYCEGIQNRAYITQEWEMVLDKKPGRFVHIPKPPLLSVVSITFTDDEETDTTVSGEDFIVDTVNEPGRVVLKKDKEWPDVELPPIGGVKIRFRAGYGSNPTDVPKHIKQAMLLIIGHWFTNREAVAGGQFGQVMSEVPMAANALLQMNRVIPV